MGKPLRAGSMTLELDSANNAHFACLVAAKPLHPYGTNFTCHKPIVVEHAVGSGALSSFNRDSIYSNQLYGQPCGIQARLGNLMVNTIHANKVLILQPFL